MSKEVCGFSEFVGITCGHANGQHRLIPHFGFSAPYKPDVNLEQVKDMHCDECCADIDRNYAVNCWHSFTVAAPAPQPAAGREVQHNG